MTAPEILSNEHRAIELVLEAMEKSAARLETGNKVDPSIVVDCLDFASGFADKCHHAKEEDALFPMLEKRGVAKEGWPIGVMLHDHQIGRDFILSIRENLTKWQSGDESAAAPLAEALKGYAGHLRSHIYKEDNVLFVMASGLLSDEDNAELIKAFDDIEEKKIGPGVHEAYHKMLDELEDKIKQM